MIAPSGPVNPRRPVLSKIGWGVLALAAMAGGVGARAVAQETVVIGGSGLPSVEIHLDALEQVAVAPAPQPRLLMPGERRPDFAGVAPSDVGVNLTAARDPAPAETPRLDLTTALESASQPAADAAAPEPVPVREMAVAPPAAEEVPEPAPTAASSVAAVPEIEPEPAPIEREPAPVVEPVAEPEPARAAEPVGEPEPRQVASLSPVALPPEGGHILLIEFSGAGTRLSPAAEEALRAVATAVAEADGRLQLQAFAGGSGENASGARRTSLSRALAVRSFLIEAGVRSTRVDVRALGTAGDSGPAERVDVLYVAR